MYSVNLARDYFTFSAAHFVVPDDVDRRELLHGHNYAVSATVESGSLSKEVVVDFAPLKRAIAHICGSLNHKMLIPRLNSHLLIGAGEASVGLGLKNGAFLFPRTDLVLLPVANVTCETLARWIAENLVARTDAGLQSGMRLTIAVEECPGQSGSYSLVVSDLPDRARYNIASPEKFDYDKKSLSRAFKLARAASEHGSSPFGAVITQDGVRVAEASNETSNDSPVNHAELVALRKLRPSRVAGGSPNLTLYATCEPCIMCLMAAFYASVSIIVYATPIADAVRRSSGDPEVDARAVAAALSLPLNLIGPVDPHAGRRIFDSHLERWGRL